MSALQPYPEYRGNGFDLLDNGPKGWVISKFNYEIDFLEGPGILAVDFHEEGIPLLRIQNVKGRYVSSDFKTYLSPSQVLAKWTHFRTEVGDLIISASASTGLISEISSNTSGAVPYTGLIRLRPKSPRIYRDFIRYFVQSSTFHTQINLLQTGATIQHFGPIHLQQLRMVVPSTNEQQKIANFLDHETAKIDTLIEKQQQLIKLLKEKRQAVISHAVTKGLNPDAPMKDSGVEWLGEVPEHWRTLRINQLFMESNARAVSSEELEFPVLSVSIHHGISDKELNEEESDRKLQRSEDRSLYKIVHRNYLAYNMMRAWQGGFGASKLSGLVSPAYVVCIPETSLDTSFFELLLRTDNAITELKRYSRGITDFRLRLYWDEFKNVVVPVPPQSEVDQIMESVIVLKRVYNNLIAVAGKQIVLLKERRTALISAAVTGKIDVRNWQAPESTSTPSMDA